jgi:uncharacterized protein (DUF3820 family)
MTFAESKIVVVPFGQYRGRTLDDIARTDEGLLYLDWLRGQGVQSEPLKTALDTYLDDAGIAADLMKVVRP